ncbi:MAG: acyltransferase domain-containing protein [Caldimonas sp.]
MSFALVFTGQGTQHPAMLPWLAEDDLVRSTCARLGIADWRERLADRAWAGANANAQVLLTGLALAAWRQIEPHVPQPACVAGYSVGELASFSAAGVFDSSRALALAEQRALAMNRCGQQAPGGLLAVGGLARPAIDALCAETGVALAIRNGADSVVLGGTESMLDQCEPIALRKGARVTRLDIGVASHTRWMDRAAQDFAGVLARTPLDRPGTVLFSNAAGRVRDAMQAATALAAQMASTVRWDDCMDDIHARAPDGVLEVGPGQALARLWNQRHPDVPARSCDDFRSASAVTEWIVALGPA